jgi:carboxypeptidase Q
VGLSTDSTRYFDWHHTMADTLDKVDPGELQHATATLAAATWILAEDRRTLPRYEPTAEELAGDRGRQPQTAPATTPPPRP